MTEEVVDKTVTEEKAINEQEPKFDGMSNRDALARAIDEKREVQPEVERKPVDKPAEAPKVETPTKTEVKAAVEADPEPPSEFSAAGKKAWKEKDISGIQKEFRRIHDARTQELSRAQTDAKKAREEHQTYRDLAKMADPYIKARGDEGVPPEKAIMEALALINQFKTGEPAQVKAELKKIGIDLDKAPDAPKVVIPDEIKSEIKTLQEQTSALLQERQVALLKEKASEFEAVFTQLQSEKNRTGDPVYPDLLNKGKLGQMFAREIGSLTSDAKFQAEVASRIPGADFAALVKEAYKELGGRVSGEPVKVSSSNQQHIEKSRRAAASTPGRVVNRADSSNLIGKLSNRAAIVRAYADSQEH